MLQAMLAGIDAFDGIAFDQALLDRLERSAHLHRHRPLDAATPTFRGYASDELEPCGRQRFPAFSLTGPACALDCDHCQAKILGPMIPATTPAALLDGVRRLAAEHDLRGMLLSGGSNRRNEMPYARFVDAIATLHAELPQLRILAHTALMPAELAGRLAEAGVETAMMDVIGDATTIREIYHLDRPVADFAAALAGLCRSGMRVVPHIVLGLHRGELRGEWQALEIVRDHPVDALVVIVVMPAFARPGFTAPSPSAVGRFLADARLALPGVPVILGCGRPPGLHRAEVDAYAVLAGLDAIAYPAPGAVTLARALGRPVAQATRCCALRGGPAGC